MFRRIRENPINQARWRRFKRNRRGYYSMWLLLLLFCITLPAEFLANDRPLVVSYDSGLYFPVINDYPETTFGGELPLKTNYKDPYIKEKISKKGWAIWPLIEYSYNTINYSVDNTPAPPSAENWLGTDDTAYDLLARTIYAFRISVLFGILLASISSIIGVIAGGVQGYMGGLVDLLFQRFVEIWSGLPMLFMVIILGSFVDPNFWWMLLVMILFKWMTLVPVVRAEFLKARNYQFVKAAQALGVRKWVIMWRHILPNAMVATLTFVPFVLKVSITTLTSLDYLGFGLPAEFPSLGELLKQGKNSLYAPWIGITSFVTLATLLTLLIFIGEAVRDAFDTRKILKSED